MGAQPVSRVTIGNTVFPVFRSAYEDAAEAVVFIRDTQNHELRDFLQYRRKAAKLETSEGTVYCELLWADTDYLNHRGVPNEEPRAIFLSGWQRQQLGLRGESENTDWLSVPAIAMKVSCPAFAWLLLSVRHPQLVVVVATIGAMLGVALGVLAIGLALIPFTQSIVWVILGWILIALGFAGFLLSVALLRKRLV